SSADFGWVRGTLRAVSPPGFRATTTPSGAVAGVRRLAKTSAAATTPHTPRTATAATPAIKARDEPARARRVFGRSGTGGNVSAGLGASLLRRTWAGGAGAAALADAAT